MKGKRFTCTENQPAEAAVDFSVTSYLLRASGFLVPGSGWHESLFPEFGTLSPAYRRCGFLRQLGATGMTRWSP